MSSKLILPLPGIDDDCDGQIDENNTSADGSVLIPDLASSLSNDETEALVPEFWGLSHYFFKAPEGFTEAALKKAWKEHSKDLMTQLIKQLETADDSSVEALQTAVKGWITQNEIGFGKIMMPLRVALVGALEGVDVFDIIYLIGKSETIRRIQSLIDRH